MRSLLITGGLAALLSLGACQEPVPAQGPAPGQALFFDVPAYIREQIRALEKAQPQVVKSVSEHGATVERKTLRDLNWQKELAAFAELDLNKPALRQSYTTSRQPLPDGTAETYRKKPEADGDIQEVVINFDQAGRVREIRARREEKNFLIHTRQEMVLRCDPQGQNPHVRSYAIQGLQDPLIFGPLQYVITTEIR